MKPSVREFFKSADFAWRHAALKPSPLAKNIMKRIERGDRLTDSTLKEAFPSEIYMKRNGLFEDRRNHILKSASLALLILEEPERMKTGGE